MKKAIVTGATGFIGSVFVAYLMKSGIEVLALGRKSLNEVSDRERKRLAGAAYLRLDMNEIALLSKELSGIGWNVGDDCIFFNLAWGGVNGLSDLNIEAQMKNVIWSVSALDTASRIGCRRFIQVGTMEEAFTYKYLDLDHNTSNKYNRHVIYSVAKIAAKRALKIKASQIGIEFIYVLHSHVMGPNDTKDSFLQVTLQKLIKGDDLIFSTGEQYFDVISVKDCVYGYYLIGQRGVPGSEYWVGSGDPRRLREYVERMYRLFPSGQEMQFGKLPYNDIVLNKEDFSIKLLAEHTGYAPTMTYEETVKELYDSLVK
ncbi:NAD-dependent epimerase/dehydratase family protein [Sodalinema gerasimenkoae]|uniref:NAD-dependent epimerase/dehydratase family protein n=1 Tax=Sodalinema gerasimenkoae TaxID=2862348 RepID=UPI00135C88F1|nr:NAD(P)-dependent oxidoreductase [Sodalinema gerasimenkoae]